MCWETISKNIYTGPVGVDEGQRTRPLGFYNLLVSLASSTWLPLWHWMNCFNFPRFSKKQIRKNDNLPAVEGASLLESYYLGSSPSCTADQLWNFGQGTQPVWASAGTKSSKRPFNSGSFCTSNLPSLHSLPMLSGSLESKLCLFPQSIHGPKKY